MNQDALEKLGNALDSDGSFREEFVSAKSFEDAVVVAARRGCAITAADLAALALESGASAAEELSDAHLESVGGGTKQRESLMTSILTNIANMKHESLKGIAGNLRG